MGQVEVRVLTMPAGPSGLPGVTEDVMHSSPVLVASVPVDAGDALTCHWSVVLCEDLILALAERLDCSALQDRTDHRRPQSEMMYRALEPLLCNGFQS